MATSGKVTIWKVARKGDMVLAPGEPVRVKPGVDD